MTIRPRLYQVIVQHKNHGNRITLKELADAAGVHYTTLWTWANGRTDYTNHHVLAVLCRELDVTPGDLLEYVPGYKLSSEDKLALARALLDEYILDGTTGLEGEQHVFVRHDGLVFGHASSNVQGLRGTSVRSLLYHEGWENTDLHEQLEDVLIQASPDDYFQETPHGDLEENSEWIEKFVELLADELPDELMSSSWSKPGYE